MKQSYYVAALWDAEACVWYSQSNIPGLVIEASTVAEFERLMNELAPEMLAANENIHNARVPVDFRFTGTREFAVV
ncbi:MAG: DUF1902 domain-containing protein [Caulobacteraceae bacterium]